jgi:hypothetical protein
LKICGNIAAQGAPPVSLTPGANEKNLVTGFVETVANLPPLSLILVASKIFKLSMPTLTYRSSS